MEKRVKIESTSLVELKVGAGGGGGKREGDPQEAQQFGCRSRQHQVSAIKDKGKKCLGKKEVSDRV